MEKNRQSNFELLRIIAMAIIVMHHYMLFSNFNFVNIQSPIISMWISIFCPAGKVCVDVFFIISGYFLVKQSKFRISKLLKLLCQIWITSISIFLIFIIFGVYKFNWDIFIVYLFPVSSNLWWFATSYILLYIFSPFINILLNNLNKKQFKLLLFVMLLFWFVLPTFTKFSFYYNSLTTAITLYCVGAYIKLYFEELKQNPVKLLLFAFLLHLSISILFCFDNKFSLYGNLGINLYGSNSIIIAIIAIYVFLAFKNINVKYNEKINSIASTTFGIYLIHENLLVREFIWKKVLISTSVQNSLILIPCSIACCTLVFITCIIVELIRINLIERLYIKFINKIEPKLEKIINSLLTSKKTS